MRKLYIFTTQKKQKQHQASFIKYQELPRNKKVVLISPHSDDLSVGCGGMALLLSRQNKMIPLLFFTGVRGVVKNSQKDHIQIRENEMQAEARCLGFERPYFLRLKSYDCEGPQVIKEDEKRIEEILNEIKPEIVFLCQRKDVQPRHRLATKMTLDTLKNIKSKCLLFFYETVWTPFEAMAFNSIVPLSRDVFNLKLKAIRQHKSQLRRTSFDSAARDLARFRAAVVPEQRINGYGGKIKKIAEFLEVFYIQRMR